MINIELNNIAGLRGVHSFNFNEGLSLLHAPNGTGKSSLLKAFHLLVGNKKIPQSILNNYLTEKEINGYVKISFDKYDYEVQIQRKGDSVSITYSNVDDEVFPFPAEELCYIQAKSDLYQGILKDDTSFITSWFHRVTEDHKFELFLELSTKLLSELKVERDDLKKKLSLDVTRNQDHIKDLRTESEEINKEIDTILYSEEYQKFMKDHKDKKEIIEKLRKSTKDLNNKKAKLSNEIFKDEDALEKAKRQIKKLKIELDNYDANYPVKKAQLDKFEKQRDILEENLDKSKKVRLDNQEKLDYERKLLKNYKTLLNRDKCPTCYQKLDNIVIKDLIGKTQSKIKKLETTIKNQAKGEKDIKQDIEIIEKELIDITNFLKINRQKLKQEKQEYEEVISKVSINIQNKKDQKKILTQKIEDARFELIEIQKTLVEENPLQEEVFKLQGEINSKEKLIQKLEAELEESSEYQLEYKKSEIHVKRAEEIHKHYTQVVRHLKKETFEKINESLMSSFELLELAKLKRIEFGEKNGTYSLEIVRDNNVYTTLEKLSGAEKSLITLIITWIVKQMVIPNEPLFLVDEVTTEMDDTRLKDILEYISGKTNFVIVARHKPYEGNKEVITSKNIVSTFV